ncbi:DNA repair protein RecO [Sphingomonas sp.]|jgi:DNA repair protein RecO (recombination protein O)|uniref:DNA repair protein RecO n=1 Tax=Sphingomonas sp. TaxID=28214 RepID=UPI00261544FD|nr:DNA repair protein RecO [Sphingomonas sp.]MDF2493442.1 recombination protein RecO [Sphingomonas sp.]
MRLSATAIVLSSRAHGEHGAIVRALTADDGVQAGYVRGGRSRGLRPILQPANIIIGEWRARTDAQLPALTAEMVRSRAPLHGEPLPAAALEWLTALTAAALPEGHPYPRLYQALSGLLDAIDAAPAARGWAGPLARYELLLLSELGFGLDLQRCVVTGAVENIGYISPKTGGAVSRPAAIGYEDRLLPLPAFLSAGGEADWADIFAGLAITGRFLARSIMVDRHAETLAARERLIDRLHRAVA